MQRRTSLAIAALSVALVGAASLFGQGCASSTGPEAASDYFPIVVGNSWVYSAPDGSLDTAEVKRALTVDGKTYYEITNIGSELGLSKFRPADDGVHVYIADIADVLAFAIASQLSAQLGAQIAEITAAADSEWVLLSYPMKEGDEWTVGGMSIDATVLYLGSPLGATFSISITAKAEATESIATAAGSFEAIKVAWTIAVVGTLGEAFAIDEALPGGSFWFARGVGMVQSDFGEQVSTLVSVDLK